ncbi:MAG TPA: hypothetical protein VGO93_09150 [Candidatus Xenobia bacterium]
MSQPQPPGPRQPGALPNEKFFGAPAPLPGVRPTSQAPTKERYSGPGLPGEKFGGNQKPLGK